MTGSTMERLERIRSRALIVGIGATGLLLLGALFDREQFFQSYLLAFLYWLGLGLGSLAVIMLHGVTGGAWGLCIRRFLEAAFRTLPFLALLFLPVLLGVHYLYEWSHADVVAVDELLQHKAPYLNVGFFALRALVFFTIWIALSVLFSRLFTRYEESGDPDVVQRIRMLSAGGLMLYVATMTFASIDWGMSLEPHWFSTIYGVHYIIGQALATLSLAVLVGSRVARSDNLDAWLTRERFQDLGNLMLAFVMLWAYVAFSQYLIIWSGNLPEETPWYLHRLDHGWQGVALFLILFHFAVPFVLLLSRRSKRNLQVLGVLAVLILVMRYVDLYWLIVPAFHDTLHLSWMDPVAFLAMGGLWVELFVRRLRGRPLIGLQDARALESLGGGSHA